MEQSENKNFIQDIKEIRSMMERSSKFISLSGVSGIIAGIVALAGTALAWWYLYYKLVPEVGEVSMTANKVIEIKLILFLVAIISGFLITKLGNVKPTIIGSVISSIGFFSLFLFHLSELSITINLIIIAIGISFTEVGAFNISTLFVPKQFSGISIGITTLLFLVGMSIGPAISGMFMEQYRTIVDSVVGSYPSGEAYNFIFLTGTLISIVSVALTLLVTRRVSISSSIFVER